MTEVLTTLLLTVIGWIPTQSIPASPLMQAPPRAIELRASVIPEQLTSLPEISAQHAVVIDATSMRVLGEKASTELALQASITKLATVVERLKETPFPIQSTEERPFSKGENRGIQSGVRAGERLSRRDAWAALLIPSANDVAEWIAGESGDRDAFLRRAVQSFADLGMTIEMANASGLDEGTVGSRFSAKTSAEILHFVGGLPVIGSLLRTSQATITPSGRPISLTSTNTLLLEGLPIVAGKTGTTGAAGQNIAVWVQDKDVDVLIVVLGSRDRYADVRALLGWVRVNYAWHSPL